VLNNMQMAVYIPKEGNVMCCRLKTDSYYGSFVNEKTLTLYFLHIQETHLYIKEKCRYITNDQISTYDIRTISDYHMCICLNFIIVNQLLQAVTSITD
jgi:hypothetical protein